MLVTSLSAGKQDVNIVIIFFLNEMTLRNRFSKIYWVRCWEWRKDELAGFPFSLSMELRLERWRRIRVLLFRISGYSLADQAPLCAMNKGWKSEETLSSDNSWLCRDRTLRKPLKNSRELQISPHSSTPLHLQFQKSPGPPPLLTQTAPSRSPRPTEVRKAVALLERVYYSERMQTKSVERRMARGRVQETRRAASTCSLPVDCVNSLFLSTAMCGNTHRQPGKPTWSLVSRLTGAQSHSHSRLSTWLTLVPSSPRVWAGTTKALPTTSHFVSIDHLVWPKSPRGTKALLSREDIPRARRFGWRPNLNLGKVNLLLPFSKMET